MSGALQALERSSPFEQGIFFIGTIVATTFLKCTNHLAHESRISASVIHDHVQIELTN